MSSTSASVAHSSVGASEQKRSFWRQSDDQRQRGAREELAFVRSKTLKQGASELLISTLCKPAGHDCALTPLETEQWSSLQALLLKAFPGIEEPYLVSEEQSKVFTSLLKGRENALAQLAIDYSRLVALARAIIIVRSAVRAIETGSDAIARMLLVCASAIASQQSPFSSVTDRDLCVRTLLSFRRQAVLLLDEEHRESALDEHFGASSYFPSELQNLGRAASKAAREELQGLSWDLARKAFPYGELIEVGIDFARAAYTGLAESEALPARARLELISFASQTTEMPRDEQIKQLKDSNAAEMPSCSPWQARQRLPLIGAEAYAQLSNLPAEVLDQLLSQIARTETPNGSSQYLIAEGVDQMEVVQGSSRLRFGRTGLQRTGAKRTINVMRTTMLETQSDGVRISFDTQTVSEQAEGDELEATPPPRQSRKRRKRR